MKYPWIEDFLRLRDLDSEAKCVYLAACLEPMSLADLGRATGLSRNCVKARVRSLVKAGWIEVRADGRKKLALPTAPQAVQQKYAEILKVRLSMAMYRGEAQMKLLLDTIVVSRNFVENARPDFLKSPVTQLNLEVDRLYPEVAGFEYLGAQHSKPYAAFGGQAKYETTRLNDLIKAGMTVEANIDLVHVVKVDLTIEGMKRLIPPKMKTWPLVEGPYLRTIRETCADYMKMETGDPPRKP